MRRSARTRAVLRVLERDLNGLSWAIDRHAGPLVLLAARREAATCPVLVVQPRRL